MYNNTGAFTAKFEHIQSDLTLIDIIHVRVLGTSVIFIHKHGWIIIVQERWT